MDFMHGSLMIARWRTIVQHIALYIATLDTDGGAFQSYQGSGWLVENCYSNDDNDAIHIDAGGLPAMQLFATIKYSIQNLENLILPEWE